LESQSSSRTGENSPSGRQRDDPRGACHWPRANRANHACIRLNPHGVSTMKQSYASAGKAPRRRVHSPSGIAAIAEFGLPPPRIVIGDLAHQTRSGAEPCLSFLVLECRSLECCSRRRPMLGVHSRYGLHTRAVTVYRDTLSKGFSHFVTSMTAPVASGWSGCRVGLAPTGKRRLFTAHANSRHSRL
jgi:hypothetical protein